MELRQRWFCLCALQFNQTIILGKRERYCSGRAGQLVMGRQGLCFAVGPRPRLSLIESVLVLSLRTSLFLTLKVKLNCRCLVLGGQLRNEEDRWTKVWKHHAQRKIAGRRRSAFGVAKFGDELFSFGLVGRNLAFSTLLFS